MLFTPQISTRRVRRLGGAIAEPPGSLVFVDVGANVGLFALFVAAGRRRDPHSGDRARARQFRAADLQHPTNPACRSAAPLALSATRRGARHRALPARPRRHASARARFDARPREVVRVPCRPLLTMLPTEASPHRRASRSTSRAWRTRSSPRSSAMRRRRYRRACLVDRGCPALADRCHRPAHEQGLPAGARDQDEPGLRAALTSGHRGVTISTGRSIDDLLGRGCGTHKRRIDPHGDGVPKACRRPDRCRGRRRSAPPTPSAMT